MSESESESEPESDEEEIGEITLNTYCESKQCHEIDWTIKDILSHEDFCYYSPSFPLPCSKWYFSIYPNGETRTNSSGWIRLYLNAEGCDWLLSKCASFSLGLRKLDGTVEVLHADNSFEFCKGDDASGKEKFLERSKLSERSTELTPSGALIVTCTLKVHEAWNITSRMVDLSVGFRKLFESKTGCDATLKVQNEEFPVHRAILGARSSVFETMFQVDMKEKSTGVVDIDDCHPGSFKDFLVFIYSGRFVNSSEDIFELYRIAHKYCVEQLKEVCVEYITHYMAIHNVIDAAVLGHQFDEVELKSKSQEFFENNIADVLLTDKWKSLLRKDPALANELLINLTKNMKIERY